MGLKILILEDSEYDAELIRYELNKSLTDHTCKTVHQFVDYKDELEHWQPDMILCDYNLPEITGDEVLEYTRSHYPEVSFITISGSITPEMEVALLKAQANDVLTKNSISRLPYSIQRILLDQKRKQDLEEQARFQTTLSEISLIFNSLEKFDVKVNKAIELLGEVVDVSRVYVFEDFAKGTKCKNTYEWCAPGIEHQINNLQELQYSSIPSFKPLLDENLTIDANDISDLPQDLIDEFEPQSIKAVLIFPIFLKQKYIGFIGFDETKFHREWKESEKKLLNTFCSIFSNALSEEKGKQKLIRSNKQLQFLVDEKETLVQEVHHRVKNNLALVSGFLSLERFSHDDPQTRDVINTNLLRVKSLAIIHELFYQERRFSRINIYDALLKITDDLSVQKEHREARFHIHGSSEKLILNVNQAIPFALLFVELFDKLIHTGPHQNEIDFSEVIEIFLRREDDLFVLEIKQDSVFDLFTSFESVSDFGEITQALCQQLEATIRTNKESRTLNIEFRSNMDLKGPAGKFIN